MFCKKIFLLLTCLLVSAHTQATPESVMCKTEKTCYDLNNNCVCYCSRKCGPRAKTAEDNPVYVENDPEGHYCYCKPWDLDNYYKKNCDVNNPKRIAQQYLDNEEPRNLNRYQSPDFNPSNSSNDSYEQSDLFY